jgi:6-phosphofructokinase
MREAPPPHACQPSKQRTRRAAARAPRVHVRVTYLGHVARGEVADGPDRRRFDLTRMMSVTRIVSGADEDGWEIRGRLGDKGAFGR